MSIFLSVSKIVKGQSIIEFGCGEGDVSRKLAFQGYDVTPIDIADNCLSKGSKLFFDGKFIRTDFTEGIDVTADFGFSVDTMEHIPPDRVDDAIDVILKSCKKSFFQICTMPDGYGGRIKETLHLSIHDYVWWQDKFIEHGATIFHGKKQQSHIILFVGIE